MNRGNRPNVLIVDDDAEMRALLRDVLERNDFLVREQSTADGLVPLLESWSPDAIVLDNVIDRVKGLDLLADIRRRLPRTPVVLVTAFGGADLESEALRLGATYYLDKPFRVGQLLSVLRDALGGGASSTQWRWPRYGWNMDVALPREGSLHPSRPANESVDPRKLAEHIVRDARARNGLSLFAHYERLIQNGPTDDGRARLPLLVRGALIALAGTARTRVVILSGQDACDLETQVNVPGVVYAGCRGLQLRGAGWNACHPAIGPLTDMLPTLAQQLIDRLARLANIEVEIKELGLTVHLRHADPTLLPAILGEVEELNLTSGRQFRIWPSESTIDLFPDVDGLEDSAGSWPLDEWTRAEKDSPVILYIGDVEVPYVAFHTFGYAVHIGLRRNFHAARHAVVDHAAAVELLSRVAFSWSAGRWSA